MNKNEITVMYDPIDSKGYPTSFTKTINKDGSKKSYKDVWECRMQRYQFNTIDDLKHIIDDCNDIDGCLTVGEPINDTSEYKRRLMNAEKGTPTIKKNSKINVLIIDVDDYPNPYPVTDLENHFLYIMKELAQVDEMFISTDLIFQLSSSAGIKDGSCAHIFYLLEEDYTYDELKPIYNILKAKADKLSLDVGFDGSVITRTQPIYVTDPIFEDPSQNPITQRLFTVLEANKKMSLSKYYKQVKEAIEAKKESQNIKRLSAKSVSELSLETEIKDFHLEKAISIFNFESSSQAGMGKFVTFLKMKMYTQEAVETAWLNTYNGDNYTLETPEKFQSQWNYVQYPDITYFKNITLGSTIITTDTRLTEYTIIPSWSQKSIEEVKNKIHALKKEHKLKSVKVPTFLLSSKVPANIKEFILNNIRYNFMKFNLTII